jgi:hypothetical protein
VVFDPHPPAWLGIGCNPIKPIGDLEQFTVMFCRLLLGEPRPGFFAVSR